METDKRIMELLGAIYRNDLSTIDRLFADILASLRRGEEVKIDVADLGVLEFKDWGKLLRVRRGYICNQDQTMVIQIAKPGDYRQYVFCVCDEKTGKEIEIYPLRST